MITEEVAGWTLDESIDWSAVDISPEEIEEIQGRPLSDDPFLAADIAQQHGAPIFPDPEDHKAYVVFVGRNPGVYQTWDSTAKQVNKYSGAVHKGYNSIENARVAWANSQAKGTCDFLPATPPPSSDTSHAKGSVAMSLIALKVDVVLAVLPVV
ncbi:Caulimovirus viroplasmin-domain-containing protein [Ephemerocybe angulata]|uniref:Caulimovirus viroplasmin-domain-containing protein n=1 Tax=Ephemerocybe angulata TaxID=980116 RepID=A0A8H6HB32_9AGAR|nr:Caulimovirus viroplasmin-domain-containing protein [Tulosesus angulatus]